MCHRRVTVALPSSVTPLSVGFVVNGDNNYYITETKLKLKHNSSEIMKKYQLIKLIICKAAILNTEIQFFLIKRLHFL